MKGKLKYKILIYVSIAIVTLMTISTIIIAVIINKNTRELIEKDMRTIIKYTGDGINNLSYGEEKSNYLVLNKVSNLFDSYISIEGKKIEEVGEIILKSQIESYRSKEETQKSLLTVSKTKNNIVGTLYYPMYVNNYFIGKVIVQKSYEETFIANKRLFSGIFITEIIITVVLLIIVYVIVSKSTRSLEGLTLAIKDFSSGKRTIQLEIAGKDEIAVLTNEFNAMAENIETLQNSSRDFFDKATHELKTPLTSIKGYSQLLSEENFQDDFVKRALSRLELESSKMEVLVENLLILSREGRALKKEKEEIFVGEFLNKILDEFTLRITKNNIKIIKKVEGEISLEATREDLEILIRNLIDNSIKYSSDKKIGILLIENSLIIKNSYNDNYIDLKSNLLEPFTKGKFKKGEVSSSGLGLYICKRICEKNNWDISYDIKGMNIIEFNIKF